MSLNRPWWLWLGAAVLAGMLLSGSSVSVNFGNSASSPSPASPKSSSPTSGASATVALTLAVTDLPTQFGVAGMSATYPATVRFRVPRDLEHDVAAYGVAGVVVLGPSDWTGTNGLVGVDGSAGFILYPKGERPSGGSPSGGPQMGFQYDGGCVGCSWTDASAFFPAVAQAASSGGTGTSASPPAGLTSETLGPGLIDYSAPVPEVGYQSNGVAFTTLPGQDNETVPAVFEKLGLTFPAAEHPLAEVILDAFVDNEDRYVCSGTGSSPASVSLLLQGQALGQLGPC